MTESVTVSEKKKEKSAEKVEKKVEKKKTSPESDQTISKRERSKSKHRETPKKRKVSEKKPKKKSTIRNECYLSKEYVGRIRDDIQKEITFVSKNGNIPTNSESWKNSYYRNYDLGEEIAKS